MRGILARGLTGAVIGSAIFFLAYLIAYSLPAPVVVEPGRPRQLPSSMLTGLHESELSPSGNGFIWTSDSVSVALDDVDRRIPWRLDVRLSRGPRPSHVHSPTVRALVDGELLSETTLGESEYEISLVIPPRSGGRGLALRLTTDPSFVPGPHDPRTLGVNLLYLRLAPVGISFPSVSTCAAVVLAGGALGVVGGLAPLPLAWLLLILVPLAALYAWACVVGWLAYTPYPTQIVALILYAQGLAAIVLVLQYVGGCSSTARALTGVSALFVAAKLLLLFHPLATEGDIGFHLNRLKLVQRGVYYFTSAAPGGAFPYPVALYVAVKPFLQMTADWALAMRLLVLAADACAGWLLSFAVWRFWRSVAAGLTTLMLFHLAPANFQVQAVSYLTNGFGQAMSVCGLSLIALVLPVNLVGTTVAGLFVLTAFLSHVSSFLLLATTLLICVPLWTIGRDASARAAVRLASVLGLAIALAIGVYYAHFIGTYRQVLTDLGAKSAAVTAVNAPIQRAEAHQTVFVPGWEPFKNRVAAVPKYARKYWGCGLTLVATVGFAGMLRDKTKDLFALLLWAWLIAGLAFFAIGQVSAIDVRYYLGLAPCFAGAGGYAVQSSRERGRLWRAAIWAAVLVAAVEGSLYSTSWFGPVLPR